MVNQYQVRGGTNIFKGLITEVCRLPVNSESRLRFRIEFKGMVWWDLLFQKVPNSEGCWSSPRQPLPQLRPVGLWQHQHLSLGGGARLARGEREGPSCWQGREPFHKGTWAPDGQGHLSGGNLTSGKPTHTQLLQSDCQLEFWDPIGFVWQGVFTLWQGVFTLSRHKWGIRDNSLLLQHWTNLQVYVEINETAKTTILVSANASFGTSPTLQLAARYTLATCMTRYTRATCTTRSLNSCYLYDQAITLKSRWEVLKGHWTGCREVWSDRRVQCHSQQLA